MPGLELRFSTPQAFFEAIAAQRDCLPVVTAELQHCFPGCYSVMHDIKQGQRQGEQLLEQTERVVDAFVDGPEERQDYLTRLDAAWDDLLFTQFHDVLAGTSIPSAWTAVRALQGRARIAGEEIVLEASRRWARRCLPAVNAQQVVVLNPDEADFEGYVEAEPPLDFDLWNGRWLSDLDGQPIPFQLVQAESAQMIHRVVFPRAIAAGGFAHVLVQDAPAPLLGTTTDLEATPHRLANNRLIVDLDGSGIAQLTVDGQALLGAAGIRVQLRRDGTDTWTMTTDRFREPVEALWQTEEWVVEETGPLRARLRAEGWVGHSRLRWTLTLYRGEPRLRLQLEVSFSEDYRLLQLAVHLAESPERHVDGLPGGCVERVASTSEWPVQGWSRIDTSRGQTVLVTNDAYSLSLDHATWQWTLLRSPKMAWMGDEWAGGGTSLNSGHAWHTDQGAHTFDFVLLTGEELPAATLDTAARQLGQPPIVFDRYDGSRRPPWGNNPPRHLVDA